MNKRGCFLVFVILCTLLPQGLDFSGGTQAASPAAVSPPLLAEILQPALTSWNVWHTYSNGLMPYYDEYLGTYGNLYYPEGVYAVYLYMLTGNTSYLDYAAATLTYASSNLINENGVLMSATQTGAQSTTPIDAEMLAYYLQPVAYLCQLQPELMDYGRKIADAALKFQTSLGLFASQIDSNGTVTDSTDTFATRSLGSALMRFYEVSNDTRYLDAAERLISELWNLRNGSLIWDSYDALTGSVLTPTTRCHGQWQFIALAKYAYLLTGKSSYMDTYQNGFLALYKTFWFTDHWNYRTGYDLWEYYQPVVVNDLLAMGECTAENLVDINKRIVNKLELSRLGLIIHAVDSKGTPTYNWNDGLCNQIAAFQNAWAFDYLGGNTGGYDQALGLFRTLVKYHRKSHGYIGGVDSLTGDFYHTWGTDQAWFEYGVQISWMAQLLILKISSTSLKLDFGKGFSMPYRLGFAYAAPYNDKFAVNLTGQYVRFTVQSGDGVISLPDRNITSVTKDNASYAEFSGSDLTVDSPGTYTVHFNAPPPHDVAVANVNSPKTVICQFMAGNVITTVANLGINPETVNVTIYATLTSVMKTTLIGTFTNVPIDIGASIDLTLVWFTMDSAKGTYAINAYAWPVPGETDTANNNFTIGPIYVSMVGDLTGTTPFVPDGKCDGRDTTIVAKCFGSNVGDARYNPNCDLLNRGKIDGKDITIVAKNFGEHDP